MVRGTTKAIVGAAGAVARTALAAAPLVGRSDSARSDDAVQAGVPEQGGGPAQETDAPVQLVTVDGEDPWTRAEVVEVHTELTRRAAELRAEVAGLDADLDGLIRSGGEGTGQDSADVGAASSERDQEISLVNNARAMLQQTERALDRLAAGSFGVCEGCGGAIGKMRVMAFPRATLCMSCKQREERR